MFSRLFTHETLTFSSVAVFSNNTKNKCRIKDGFFPDVLVERHSPHGRGWDVVIEAVGLPETWEKAVGLCRRGGKVHWFAGCPSGSTVTLDTKRLHYDEITLFSLFHHTPHDVKKAFDLLVSGQINPRPLISESFALKDLEHALAGMEAGHFFKASIITNECNLKHTP